MGTLGFTVCRCHGQLDELFIDRMAGCMVEVFQGLDVRSSSSVGLRVKLRLHRSVWFPNQFTGKENRSLCGKRSLIHTQQKGKTEERDSLSHCIARSSAFNGSDTFTFLLLKLELRYPTIYSGLTKQVLLCSGSSYVILKEV